MASLESIIFSLVEYKKKESKMKEAEILDIISQVVGKNVTREKKFYDVGLMNYGKKTELKNVLNKKYELSLSESSITSVKFNNIGEFVDYLIPQIANSISESALVNYNVETDIEAEILRIITQVTGSEANINNTFYDVGITSYAIKTKLKNALNEKFGLSLYETSLNFGTIAQLVDYLKTQMSQIDRATTESYSTSENRGTIKSEDLEKQILTTIAGSLGLTSVKRDNSFEFLGLNKYSNLLNVWIALNKKFSLNLQIKELNFDNVGQLVDYLKARISGKIKAPQNNACKQPNSTNVKSSINNRKIEKNNTSTTNKIKCPNCGYVFEESVESSMGKSALVFGAGLAAGVLLGGPVGGAVGGLFGQMISKAITRGVKGTVSGIINRCPKCGTDVKTGDNWFGSE